MNLPTLPVTGKGSQSGRVLLRRSGTVPPLPWSTFAPPLTYLKVRRGGRIVSVAVIIAIGVNGDGRREVLGMEIGTSEAEPIWTEFLRKLAPGAARRQARRLRCP